MRYTTTLLAIICILITACNSDEATDSKFQAGDILLQDLDCGDACNAIESVTEGANGWDFSHCGIVVEKEGKLWVVEAYGAVQEVLLDSFLQRNVDSEGKPKVLIGRPKDKELAKQSAELVSSYLGKGYDDAFTLGDDKYYCSELVYECFKKANDDKEYFPLNVMTFKTPGTDSIMPFWVAYYKELNQPVPEGAKGINPGAISRSDKLELIEL